MKLLKWALALGVIGCIAWGANWYHSRPSVPTVSQVTGAIVQNYGGNKGPDGRGPFVKVSVSRVRDIQRVGYMDFTAIADVTLVLQDDPFIPGNEYTGIARGMGEKKRIGEDMFKVPQKAGESIAEYLPIGTTRKLRNQPFELEHNTLLGRRPNNDFYWIKGRP